MCARLVSVCIRGGGDGCHLRVVPPGQLHRRPSTSKRFYLSAIFIEPGFIYFLCREVSFSCGFFPVFAFRWFRVFHRGCCLFSNSFQFKFFIYFLYIHIYIFFIYFFIVQWLLWSVLGDFSGMSPPDWSSSTYFVHRQNFLKYILVYRHWLIYQGCDNLFNSFSVHCFIYIFIFMSIYIHTVYTYSTYIQ